MFTLILLASLAADPSTITGRVVGVADGDTLTVLTADKTEVKVRLHGIDAPELGQPFGNNAKRELSRLAFQKEVTVIVTDRDKYGRTVGTVKAGGLDVNAEMVKGGMAWHFEKYAKGDKGLASAQKAAKQSRSGLWSESDPVAPWDWRDSERKAENDFGAARKTNLPKGANHSAPTPRPLVSTPKPQPAPTVRRETSPPQETAPRESYSGDTTPTGKRIYTGPRGGRYHYSASGKKVYERRKK